MTEFLGVPFYSDEFIDDVPPDFGKHLVSENVGFYQLKVRGTLIDQLSKVLGTGFDLVDSKLEFITSVSKPEFAELPAIGSFRLCEIRDWDEIRRLTSLGFSKNTAFKGRFNNRRYFSEDISLRYYMAWNERAFSNSSDLFGVWSGEKIFAYYNINRLTDHDRVVHKVGLAAVDSDAPSRGIQNMLQNWIYHQAPETTFTVINSPALSNIPGLKNNIRAGRDLNYTELTFFYVNGVELPLKG